MWFLIPIAGLAVATVAWLTKAENERNKEADEKKEKEKNYVLLKINKIVAQHLPALILTFKQSVYRDQYGNEIFKKWYKEVDYFIEKVVVNEIEIPSWYINFRREFFEMVTKIVANEMKKNNRAKLTDDMTAREFEDYCISILNKNGWTASNTKVSGDQGIDILASFGNIKFVFQCKMYTKPVGNKAVQEIIAGKIFAKADIAAVVSNQSFTVSARQLAEETKVLLLHYSDLNELAKKLGLRS